MILSESEILKVLSSLSLAAKYIFLKVWWQDATLFVYFSYFITFIHSFNHIHTIHLSIAFRWGLSPFLHRLSAQWERPPCGAEPRIELGPALQQADALPTEPRRTILSHAAPFWATPHHSWATPHHVWATPHHAEPRRTILSHAAPYWATPHHAKYMKYTDSWNVQLFVVGVESSTPKKTRKPKIILKISWNCKFFRESQQ